MIDFDPAGAVFDVDDTLLDDNVLRTLGNGLHERSRLAAAQAVGIKYGISGLAQLSVQDNIAAFANAPVHTLEAAIWVILQGAGVVSKDAPADLSNQHLREIFDRKSELYEKMLAEEGEAVPGAVDFVRELSNRGLSDKLAIASTAMRRDVDVFLAKTGLAEFFPSRRIKTKESFTHPKPHPEVFDLAFKTLDLPEDARSRVCAFEDDPRGIMSARAAGLYVCAIATRYTCSQLNALEVPPHFAADTYEKIAEHFGIRI